MMVVASAREIARVRACTLVMRHWAAQPPASTTSVVHIRLIVPSQLVSTLDGRAGRRQVYLPKASALRSRISALRTLPVTVMGNSSTTRTYRGTL